MKYKLIGNNDTSNILNTVLNNRGIQNTRTYLTLNDNCFDDFDTLDNINEAVELFDKHFLSNNKIAILSDTDTDGLSSSTIMYKYIKMMDENYPVDIIVHQKSKAHGLASWDFDIPHNTKLLIIPDAGTNDIEECKKLIDLGIDVLIIDHHTKSDDKYNPAVLVNNQVSDLYSNKEACGAHITYNFLQALDQYYWNDFCNDNFVDLVALADVADVMSLKSFGTRAMVNYGFRNIQNKMLKEIIKAQEFSMKGIVSPFTVAFYVAPLINAFLRSATFEERVLLVKAFCEYEEETFEYTKRGESFPIEENIYEHTVRIMRSYKGKQDRARDKAFNTLVKKVEKYSDDKVIIVDVSEELDSAYTGLVAIKLSENINKPVLLVRETPDGYAGSGRAFNYCPIEDFRALVDSSPYSKYGTGHPSAFGVCLTDINQSRQWFNEQLKDISFEKVYTVDFVVDAVDIHSSWCYDIHQNNDVFAHGVDEPLWLIKNIYVSNDTTKIVGKNFDTIQIYDESTGIKYVQFKCKENNQLLKWLNEHWGEEEVCVNIIGTLGINEYQGVFTPQVNIQECEIIEGD